MRRWLHAPLSSSRRTAEARHTLSAKESAQRAALQTLRACRSAQQRGCLPHLQAGLSQQCRQARERRLQCWGHAMSQNLSQTCQPHHRPPRGCASGSLLRCWCCARVQRAIARAPAACACRARAMPLVSPCSTCREPRCTALRAGQVRLSSLCHSDSPLQKACPCTFQGFTNYCIASTTTKCSPLILEHAHACGAMLFHAKTVVLSRTPCYTERMHLATNGCISLGDDQCSLNTRQARTLRWQKRLRARESVGNPNTSAAARRRAAKRGILCAQRTGGPAGVPL